MRRYTTVSICDVSKTTIHLNVPLSRFTSPGSDREPYDDAMIQRIRGTIRLHIRVIPSHYIVTIAIGELVNLLPDEARLEHARRHGHASDSDSSGFTNLSDETGFFLPQGKFKFLPSCI